MKRRGGFVPLNSQDPARSLISCAGSLAGTRTPSNRAPLPAAVKREETHGLQVLPRPGLHASFPADEAGHRQRTIERRASEQVMSVAGRVLGTSPGTKPISATSGLFANFSRNLPPDVIACVGGPQTGDATQNEGPGGSELITCSDARRSIIH